MESLFNQMRNVEGLIFHEKAFKDFLEMNMADLRRASLNLANELEVTEAQMIRADRNFNLLCNIAKIPYHLHWVTMRVNNLRRVSDYSYKMKSIYHIDQEKLAALIQQYREAQSIT